MLSSKTADPIDILSGDVYGSETEKKKKKKKRRNKQTKKEREKARDSETNSDNKKKICGKVKLLRSSVFRSPH